MVPPGASTLASRTALSPPTAFSARRIGAPFTAAEMSPPSTITSSAPSAFNSSATSARRTTFTVRQPKCRAMRITQRPTAELARFCTTHSPGSSFTKSRNINSAVAGLIRSIAACSSEIPSGTAIKSASFALPASRHEPKRYGSSTRWPDFSITPTPSTPGTPGSAGRTGYLPSSTLMSAG